MTSRTDDRREARSGPRGTSKGTPASASVRLARTIRWATVASGTRNARAISAVVRPPNRRSVSATRASVESTGWQVVNMRRRRSSPMSSSIAASRSGTAISRWASISRPSSWCLRSASLPRRKRSIARRFAVAMSHAPGLSGTPDSGHRSSAATRASWARSSARPTSRTIRARPAMSLADSILQTASIVRWVSVAVTATDHTIFDSISATRRSAPGLPLGGHLLAQALLSRAQLARGVARREVLGLEHLADLHLGVLARSTLEPLDRLRLGLHLPEPEAGDQLLGLGERPVDHGPLPAGEPDPRALRAGLQPPRREHHARLGQLLVELLHVGKDLLVGEDAGLGVLVGFDDHHETHFLPPSGFGFGPTCLASPCRRT